jgi:hypothetical protein
LIDQRIAGSAVIGDDFFACAYEGEIGNAADIDEDDGGGDLPDFGETSRQGGVIGGNEWRAPWPPWAMSLARMS